MGRGAQGTRRQRAVNEAGEGALCKTNTNTSRTNDEHELLGAAEGKDWNQAAPASLDNVRHLLRKELLAALARVVLRLAVGGLLLGRQGRGEVRRPAVNGETAGRSRSVLGTCRDEDIGLVGRDLCGHQVAVVLARVVASVQYLPWWE